MPLLWIALSFITGIVIASLFSLSAYIWLGAVLAHRCAVFRGVFMKHAFQLRVYRTLAAVVHDYRVERFVEFVEADLVVADEGI